MPSGRMKAKAPQARPAASRKPAGCPIVGIGASAGGLEAFTALLKQLPLDTGFGFVLVQHLDPQHDSALTQLLARTTAMPVQEATNHLRVEANHVYIIPPNATLAITRGVLRLQPRARDGRSSRAIDHFLESLALDLRERAIGVILSGSATDGTLGLEAIKAEGGLTFAQDGSARYDSMPRSAAAAGCVDFVLAPGKIARELARIARHPLVAAGSAGRRIPLPAHSVTSAANHPTLPAAPEAEQAGYQKILQLLYNHSGVDFSLYKTTTIHRRVTRRAVLNRSETLAKYAGFLQGNPKELDALYSDSLINVTSFFRNPEAFTILKQKVFAPLLRQRDDEPIRVWVLGCSTGQEAYSMAMAYAEAAGKVRRPRPLQVFATDLNEANLQKARQGFYAKSLAQDLSPERLRRFFLEEPDGYQVIKSIREQVVFARHNLISDPPFSRMDLISCRNLMIYLEPSLQKKAVPAFHYALKPAGALLLGASESVGGFSDLFAPLDKKNKLFVKKAAPPQSFQLPVKSRPGRPRPAAAPPALAYRAGPAAVFQSELNAEREADRVTVNQFAPPSVLIDDRFQILQFRGPTGSFLEPPTGKASFDLMKMAREGLMLPLRATISLAQRQNGTARKENVPFNQDGRTRAVHLEVVPLKNLKEPRFLVLFEDATFPLPAPAAEAAAGAAIPPRRPKAKADSSRIIGLERDLAETRDYLQSIQEHQESANEELQASHEEGQSANEELQSLNEELETSKEELESTNEELTTVNEEMVSRNAELNRVNSDLTNLQASAKLVIVLLGRDLSIRRFSTEAKKQFHLLSTDVGAPFRHIRHNLDFPELEQFMTEVIVSVRERECEVRDREGHWYSLRVSPYLTADNKVDGAVLVLVDINSLKTIEQEATNARDFSEAIIDTARDPLLILDSSFRIHKANQSYFKSFATSAKAILNRSLFDINRGQWDLPALRLQLKKILPKRTSFDDLEVTLPGTRGGRRTLLLNGRTLSQAPGHREKILLGIQDVTEILHFQARLRKSELRYRRLFEAAQDGILMLDPATRKITEANPYIVKLLGYSRDQLVKKELWQIGLLKDEAASQEAFRELKANGFIRYEDLPLISKQGQRLEVEFVSNLYDEDGQSVIQCNIRNITERKRHEELLRLSEERYRNLFNSIDEGFCVFDMLFDRRGRPVDYRFVEVNPSFEKQSGIRAAVGKRMLTIAPQMEPAWFRFYGHVALTGKPKRFVGEAKALHRWFDVYAFRLGGASSRRVAVLFSDITVRKQVEADLRLVRAELAAHAAQLEVLVERRTAQLTETNRALEKSVALSRQKKEALRVLLDASDAMQQKLRHMARQIITAQEDERRKISRDLHDDVVQTLVSINVELAALTHGTSDGGLQRKIGRTQRLVEKSVNAVHQFARELRPALLDDLGLIPALHAHIKQMAARTNLRIHLTAFAGVETLTNHRRTTLYRVALEALANVVRHAHASHVTLTFSKLPGAVRMEIHDNGQSFEVPSDLGVRKSKRLGLLGMRERVEMVDGTLTVVSRPGKGTTVRAEIPFKPQHPTK